MSTYQLVYGEGDEVVRETYRDIDDVQREDGWVTLFRGNDAILRVQDQRVISLERAD